MLLLTCLMQLCEKTNILTDCKLPVTVSYNLTIHWLDVVDVQAESTQAAQRLSPSVKTS